jgi:hypothetical protein
MAFGDGYPTSGSFPEPDTRNWPDDLSDGLIIKLDRHPDVRHFATLFAFSHLSGRPRRISSYLARVAQRMVDEELDEDELAAGLRKLLEAKDCFVRAAL